MRLKRIARNSCIVLALVAASMLWGCCDWCPPNPPQTTTVKGAKPKWNFRMVLSEDCVGPWAPLNNSFATYNGNPTTDATRWHGVFAQLGKYDDFGDRFMSVKLSKNGGTVLELARNEFTWVNIVSDSSEALSTPPMVPDDVVHLVPPSGTTCGAVESCASTAGCVTDPNWMKCFRQEKIHKDLTVDSVVTLWTSKDGYRVKADAVEWNTTHPAGLMRYEFQLEEEVQIDIYRSSNATPDFSYAPGDVDLIEFTTDTKGTTPPTGPSHGTTDSPPWPKP